MTNTLKQRLLILAVGAVTLTILAVTPVWPWLQRLLQPVLMPITSVVNKLGTSFGHVWGSGALVQANEQLRHELAAEVGRRATAEALVSENASLRALLALPPSPEFEALAVEVVGQQVDETGTTYLINRGYRDGLTLGMAVVAGSPQVGNEGERLLVGTLTGLSERLAGFSLTTSSASRVLVELKGQTESRALAIGEFNLAIRLKFIELKSALATGDVIVTSYLNTFVPAGLLVGSITSVEQSEGELFQSAVVVPPVNLTGFRFLHVLRPLTVNLP